MAPAVVAQRDLDMIIGLDNQIRSLREMRDAQCGALLTRMLAGCPVEPGHHSASLQQSGNGATRTFSLVFDGRKLPA